MSATATIVRSQFPQGADLPIPIRLLCDFVDAKGYPISGCFEINTRKGEAASWFPNDEKMQQQIAVFGNGSTGSTYALWLLNANSCDDAPVVVLGSEGDFIVLAESPLQFVRLLGCGYDELEWDDLANQAEGWAQTEGFRRWFAERMEIDFPDTGAKIVQLARDRFPSFSDWVTSWQEANLRE